MGLCYLWWCSSLNKETPCWLSITNFHPNISNNILLNKTKFISYKAIEILTIGMQYSRQSPAASYSKNTINKMHHCYIPICYVHLHGMLTGSGLGNYYQWLTEHFQVWQVQKQKTDTSMWLFTHYLLTSTTSTMLFTICTYNGCAYHSLHNGIDCLT